MLRVSRATAPSALAPALGTVLATTVAVPAPASSPSSPARTSTAGQARSEAARPNIVVVMADDMRVDDLRFAPHVRRLVAQRGLTFRNSFSP